MALNDKERNVLTAGLILAGMFMVIFVYLHFVFFKKAIASNQKQQSKIEAETADLRKELNSMVSFLREREKVNLMKERLEIATSKLPSEPQAVKFLEELRTTLERTGVRQRRVSPKTFVPRTLYTEIPYEVQGSARYHEFGQFLNLIECNPRRFMRVNSFDLRNSDARPTVHPVTIGISTFMFNRPAE